MQKMKISTELIYNELKVDVVYYLHEGEPEIRYDSNGTGQPGYDAYVEIVEVWATLNDHNGESRNVNVIDILSQNDIEWLEDEIIV